MNGRGEFLFVCLVLILIVNGSDVIQDGIVHLLGCRNSSSSEGRVDDGRDKGGQRWGAGFNQNCRERVQLTDDWLGLTHEI